MMFSFREMLGIGVTGVFRGLHIAVYTAQLCEHVGFARFQEGLDRGEFDERAATRRGNRITICNRSEPSLRSDRKTSSCRRVDGGARDFFDVDHGLGP